MLLLAVLAVPIGSAVAAKRKPVTVDHSRHLWATVNLCDPASPPAGVGPDTIGIRASMPGSADGRERMYMRVRLQQFDEADMKWHSKPQASDSIWQWVGLARYKARQGGRNFRFSPPPDPSIRLRGKVNFEWRLKGEVVRRAVKLTTAGHKSTTGTFPAGFSAAECTISAP